MTGEGATRVAATPATLGRGPDLSVSVVVPVYGGEKLLEPLVDRLGAALSGRDYEIVLVNDGSPDDSWRRVLELCKTRPRLRGLDLARNYGQHNALLAGVRAAEKEVVVTMDDDLQHPPEEVPKLLDRLESGIDIVYALPRQRAHGFWRNVSARLTRFVIGGAVGIELADKVSAFRAFRTELRDSFAYFQGPYVALDVLLSWSTTRVATVQFEHDPRRDGESTYSFMKLVGTALTMATGFSTRPLRLASLLGLIMTFFGLILFVGVVVGHFVRGSGTIPGFSFLASTIVIFSGVQLFTLGVIGEYIARMHVRLMDRPTYAVREEVRSRAGVEQNAPR